jgi:hypothetical protein
MITCAVCSGAILIGLCLLGVGMYLIKTGR